MLWYHCQRLDRVVLRALKAGDQILLARTFLHFEGSYVGVEHGNIITRESIVVLSSAVVIEERKHSALVNFSRAL